MAVSKRLRYEILRRDNHTCRYCGRSAPNVPLRVDHVVPVALGGTDDPANLVTACEPCNSGKTSSAPDASLIASASDDQLRWALAMKQACEAAVAKRFEMDEYRAAFRKEWDQWTSGGEPFDLPADWTISMDRFHNAGLPAFMWDEIVTKTMAARRVGDPFKYACGIAWKEVAALQDAARNLLGAPASGVTSDDLEDEGDTWSLLEDVLPAVGQQRYEAALADIRDLYEGEGYSESELSEHAAGSAVMSLASDASRLERQVRRLLTLLPAHEVQKAQRAATQVEKRWVRLESEIPSARFWTSTVDCFLQARADLAVAAMKPSELSEWMQYVATALNDDDMPSGWGTPTEEALHRRAGEAALMYRAGWHYASMCGLPGAEIEVCPRRTKTQVSFAGCPECGISPAPPEGIDVCSEHFELILAGKFCQHVAVTEGRCD